MLERTDSGYLEALTDEEFFARRFTLSEEDQEELMRNSTLIDGHRFYRAAVKEKLFRKYAAETNPQPGEPGTKENPLVRFGKEYVYDEFGSLTEYVRHTVHFILRPDMKPTAEQKRMILRASKMPIQYCADCPELSEQTLEEFRKIGQRRNRERAQALKV